MSGKKARFGGFLLGGMLALAAVPACAQGFRFGGFHLGGPRFDGPRFDGPGGGPMVDPLDAPPHGPALPREPLPPPPPGMRNARNCFSPPETRARVAQFKLRPPFEMMQRAQGLAHAQALAGKLCRWADLDIYDISLLRPDGRVVHVFFEASTGREIGAPPHQN